MAIFRCWTLDGCFLQTAGRVTRAAGVARPRSSEKGEAVLSFLLAHHIIRITSKHVQRDKARGGGWFGGVAVGRFGRTKSRAAVDVERPRKDRERRVRDLLPPNRIAHVRSFEDECLLLEEGVRRLRLGGTTARDIWQMPVLQDTPSDRRGIRPCDGSETCREGRR